MAVPAQKPVHPPGALVYTFATPKARKGKTLYVNAVGRYGCTNNCRFCHRKDAIEGKPNIYEKKAGTGLFLPGTPTPQELTRAIQRGVELHRPETISFVGLGEPLISYETILRAIIHIRSGFRGKISMDTNGQAGIWAGGTANIVRCLANEGLDEIRISLNAATSRDYASLCRPKYGEEAFREVCGFLRGCLRAGMEVFASFVVGFDDGKVKTKDAKTYTGFAVSLGVKPENVLLREYVPPIAEK